MSTHEEFPHKSTKDKLAHMANQIGTSFRSQEGEAGAPAKVTEHILKYWDPRMRKDILAHLDAGGKGLDPIARQAVEALRRA
jgi:formate dehydrogenase subunit delta